MLKNMDGVVTVMQTAGQYQVVIGNHVPDVFRDVCEVAGISGDGANAPKTKRKFSEAALDIITGIFMPSIGILCASGILKGVNTLLDMVGLVSAASGLGAVSYTHLTDEIFTAPQNAELEMKKAASFRSIKRKLRKKQILVVVLAFAIFAAASFSIVGFLKNSEQVISYENNISVSMADDSLIGRLQGNQANYLKIKQVEIKNYGQPDTYLFFYMSGTKWDDLITNDDIRCV